MVSLGSSSMQFFSSSFTGSVIALFLRSSLSDTDINAPFMLLFSFSFCLKRIFCHLCIKNFAKIICNTENFRSFHIAACGKPEKDSLSC